MAVPFASVLRACCVAFALTLAFAARAAEPVSPLLGATMEQVVSKYGDPKSQITVGNRIVMFYPRERIVVRDGRVIEVEQLTAEPVRRPEPAPVAPPAIPPVNPAPGAPNLGGTAPAVQANPGVPPAKAGEVTAPAVPSPNLQTAVAGGAAPATKPAVPAPDPKVEIKLVRPPSATGVRAPLTPAPAAREELPAEEPAPPLTKAKSGPPKPDPAAIAAAAERAAELAAKNKRAKATSSAVRRLDFAEGSALEDEGTPTWRYVLVVLVVVGGAGFFIWRSRQRQAELAATAVARTPVRARPAAPVAPVVAAPAPVVPPKPVRDGNFSVGILSRLDAPQFEALVSSYYSKTGVVAVRVNPNTPGPVRIRISWKGEPRPFAGVLCLAQATEAVDVRALRELADVLAKEDIRRGHVVTTGEFSPAARDFAAQNQLTLFPGEAFVQKLNALPESARAELLRLADSPAGPA